MSLTEAQEITQGLIQQIDPSVETSFDDSKWFSNEFLVVWLRAGAATGSVNVSLEDAQDSSPEPLKRKLALAIGKLKPS